MNTRCKLILLYNTLTILDECFFIFFLFVDISLLYVVEISDSGNGHLQRCNKGKECMLPLQGRLIKIKTDISQEIMFYFISNFIKNCSYCFTID